MCLLATAGFLFFPFSLFLFFFFSFAPINHQGEACHIFFSSIAFSFFFLQALQSGYLFGRCHGSKHNLMGCL